MIYSCGSDRCVEEARPAGCQATLEEEGRMVAMATNLGDWVVAFSMSLYGV